MSGLTITRRINESFTAGSVNVKVIQVRGHSVKLQINAPAEVLILRDECRADRPPVDHDEND